MNVKDGKCEVGDLWIIEVAMRRDAILEELKNAGECESENADERCEWLRLDANAREKTM